MKDNSDNEIEVDMYVDKVNPLSETDKNTVVMLGLVSKEHIQNQLVRVSKRFDGKLSDHVNEILTNSTYIGTEKDVDIRETQNNYNFIGNNKKPFYTCTWLAKEFQTHHLQETLLDISFMKPTKVSSLKSVIL